MTPEVKQRIDQIRQGIVPDGYKKTKSGILPESWSVRTIAECLERVEHPVEVQANEMYTQIGIRSHGKGLFYKEPVTGDSLGNKSVFWIEPDCFILNIVFAWEQAIGKTTQAEVGLIGSHRFPMYRPINGSIDIDYLISYLLTKRGTDILEAASPGGAGRNRTLGQDRFMKSRIVLPPLDEQQKIAEILATQDRAIELQGRKIEELKRFKKGCLEKMFPRKGQKVPEKRFPGFTGDWEQRKLSEMCGTFEYGLNAAAKEFDGKTNTSESRILMMPAESSCFLIFRPLIFALMVCRNIYSQAEILSLHELVQVSEKPTFTGKTTALCTLQVSLFGQKSIRTMMQNLFFKAPFRRAMRSIFVLPRSDLDSRV